MAVGRFLCAAATALALAACGGPEAPDNAANVAQPPAEPVRASVVELPAGTTPMAERVAVLGLLNKRNGLSRDLTLRPGQAVRVDDVIVRVQACETTAPWEPQQLTGAFVQVDVRNPQGAFGRVFSGWLYRESPSLNVVEHPIYDVWPKSCAMTHPAAAEAEDEDEADDDAADGAEASNRSSAPNSGTGGAATRRPRVEAPATPDRAGRTASNSAANN